MRKTAQTAARSIFALLLAGAMISTIPVDAQPAAEPDSGAMAERLGNDDGFALSIQYSGDLNGSLETCG